jgi:hypothetical protein
MSLGRFKKHNKESRGISEYQNPYWEETVPAIVGKDEFARQPAILTPKEPDIIDTIPKEISWVKILWQQLLDTIKTVWTKPYYIVLPKDYTPFWGCTMLDLQQQNIVVAAGPGVTTAILNFTLPVNFVGIITKFGYSAPAIVAPNLSFSVLHSNRQYVNYPPSILSNVDYSNSSIIFQDLAECHFELKGQEMFTIQATNAGAATIASARIYGWYWMNAAFDKDPRRIE